jgi:Ni/Co efflux regulator RcnB
MRKLMLVLVSVSVGFASIAGAQTAAATKAQLHTQNNLTKYQAATTQHMSTYSRAECNKRKGVMIKQKNGRLVCVAKQK